MMAKTRSPSSAERFLRCPRLWEWDRVGIRGESKWSPGRMAGIALHRAFAAYWHGGHDTHAAAEVLDATLAAEWAQDPDPTGEIPFEVVQKQARAVWRLVVKEILNPGLLLGDGGVVLGVEAPMAEGSHAGIVDLVTAHRDGTYAVVTEYKSHWRLPDYVVARELSATVHSWQLHQYAALWSPLPPSVQYIRTVLLRCDPPRVWAPYTVPVSAERLEMWRGDAAKLWQQMDWSEQEGPYPNWRACDEYGRCQYYGRCHEEERSHV